MELDNNELESIAEDNIPEWSDLDRDTQMGIVDRMAWEQAHYPPGSEYNLAQDAYHASADVAHQWIRGVTHALTASPKYGESSPRRRSLFEIDIDPETMLGGPD